MLAMTVGQFAAIYYTTVDPTRIGAQEVSGLGFLGAGSIIVTRDNHVSGLTTAAGLWASACIGLALGIGFYEGALVGAAVVYFAERILKKVSKRLENRDNKDNQESKL
jgi:putative Mg2+ transporter-C (MgtC) family protein